MTARLPAKAILAAAAAARRAIDKAIDPAVCEYDTGLAELLDELWAVLGEFRWAYPLKLREVPMHHLNRCRPLLSGPLFTSTKHPWPFEGGWLEPIAQIDLADAGAAGGVELGKGMLQLWMRHIDGYLRLISPNDIDAAALTPPPEALTALAGHWRFNSRIGTRFDTVTDSGFAIVGHRARVLTRSTSLPNLLDWSLKNELKPRLRAALNRLNMLMPPHFPNTAPQYFGNFDMIQYGYDERTPTLLALESDDRRFGWGDAGNAQIFYDPKCHGIDRFSFQWSCM